MDRDLIDALRDPSVFRERPDRVEIVQTHLSVVCLAGELAYKLKKPIRLPFADFSTVGKRRHFCEEEVRLNRRLCPAVYLGVVTLNRDDRGNLAFEGEGEIVDHAVKMRRLPAGRMLDVLLGEGAVSVDDIDVIAERMAAFHATSDRGSRTMALGAPEKLRAFALANFEETRDAAAPGRIFAPDLHASLARRTEADFKRILPQLRERAATGHVVDGHGDLHARNICLTDPLAIYDCIEFEPAMRCGDVAVDHAFLAMDLRFRNHAGLAEAYLSSVVKRSNDAAMRELMPAMMRYRAVVRAKVSAIAADEPELRAEERSSSKDVAQRYLRLAAALAVEEDGPWWLMCCGLPATGKSRLAAALRMASGGAWGLLASDRIRKELAGVNPEESLPEQFYTAEFSERTYAEVRRRAAAHNAPLVVLDANFRSHEERALTIGAARQRGAKAVILHVHADENVVISRLRERAADPSAESDADERVFRKLQASFEPPRVGEAEGLLDLSGVRAAEEAVDEILAALMDHRLGLLAIQS